MGKAASAKSLFRATKPKPDKGELLFEGLPDAVEPYTRDPLDYDPTPEDATDAVLRHEAPFIKAHGPIVHEAALGGGHIARSLVRHGFKVVGGDLVDRLGPAPFCLGSFYETRKRPAASHFTNPPYNEVNASNGHGRWLKHCLELGYDYIALLLNADWPNARKNGFDAMFEEHPPSIEYKVCWKIDFRGMGNPPQRNAWYVWDINRPPIGPNRWETTRLYRYADDPAQEAFDI